MLSITHLLLLLIVIFVLFGAGKLPRVMGDIGKGVRNLREGLKGEGELDAKTGPIIDHEPTEKKKD